MAPPLRKRLKRAVRSALVRAVAALVALLPLRASLALGRLVGRVAWRVAPANRRRMMASLALAFPERTEAERAAIARASLEHLGMVAAEVANLRGRPPDVERYVSFSGDGEALLRRAMARGKGLVLVAGHIGNWELLARRIARVVAPHVAVIAKRNADARLNALVERLRRDGGMRTLWREDASTGRELIRLFKAGGALGILVDQDTRVQGVFAPFFGRLAHTPRAVGDLALRFGATVVVGTCHRRGPRPGEGHELDLVEVPYDAAAPDREAEVVRLTAACVALQEAAIRRHPAEWVWMHERWKTRPPAEGSLAKEVPVSREISGT